MSKSTYSPYSLERAANRCGRVMEVGNPGILAPVRRQESRAILIAQMIMPSDLWAHSKEDAQGRFSVRPYSRPVPIMANTNSRLIQCSVMVTVSNDGRAGSRTSDCRAAECSGNPTDLLPITCPRGW